MALQIRTLKYDNKEYQLREMIGEEDLAFITEFTNPVNGKINMRELWLKRLSRCILSPTTSYSELQQMSSRELQTLVKAWIKMNEPDLTIFLEPSNDTAENTQQ